MNRWILAVLLAGASTIAAPAALAQAPEAAAEQICTTTTTVVKRGETLLSTKSETKCHREGEGGGIDIDLDPGGVLGGIFSSTPELENKDVRGDWRVVERGSIRVCKVTLMSEATNLGRRVRTQDCRGVASRVVAWKLEDLSVGLYGADGALVVRVTGDRMRLAGAAGGEEVVLQR
jgi:NaMN:DMB phosphoribosyltransferase